MVKIIEKNSIKIEKEPVILLKMSKKEYEVAWRNFWRLGKKLNRLWKTKKPV